MKTAREISEEAMADWPKDAPHLNLLREGIRQKIEGAVIAAQRDAAASAYEEAAKIAEYRKEILEEVIASGKGNWLEPGYIRDDDWTRVIAQRDLASGIEREIRALAARAKESK